VKIVYYRRLKRGGTGMENFLKRNKVLVVVLIICVSLLAGYFSYSFLLKGSLFSQFSSAIPQLGSSQLFQDLRLSSQKNEGTFNPLPEESTNEYTISTETKGVVSPGNTSSTQFGLKIMKNGNMSMLADRGKFFETWQKIIASAQSISGTVANSSYLKQGDYYSGFITIIVPTNSFDGFNETISKLGKVISLNVSTQDVTGEYVDLSSKLKVLEEQRNLLLSWLKDAKTIDEMLKLRSEIQSIETDIETIKGRLNYIAFHTDFSEITINLSEKEESFKPAGFFEPLIEALKKLYEALIFSFFGLLIIVAFILPWGLAGFGIYKFISRRKSHK